jgi:hypothetical protein
MSIQNQQSKQNLNEKETAILEYIKKNEKEPKKLTINQVATAMDKKGICSRLTTNKIIFNLMKLNIIKDEKVGNKFHKLKINDEYYYDSNKLEEELLKSQIQKALEPFKTLLKSKNMEVHIINKAKGKTEVIAGIEPTLQNENYRNLADSVAKYKAKIKVEVEKAYKDQFTPDELEAIQLALLQTHFNPDILKEVQPYIEQKERTQRDLKLEKTKSNDIYIPKPLDQYPTDDVFTPKQLQKIAMDQQKKSNKQLEKRLMDHARKEIRDKTKRRKAEK